MIGISIVDNMGNPVSIFQISIVDANSFYLINPLGVNGSGSYLGGGVYLRFSQPTMQSKQFNLGWQGGRSLRIGTQRYLMQTTAQGEITVQVFSNQNADSSSNDPGVNPYLEFSNIILTSPEPDLYGANPSYSAGQAQIWHRQSNSFNGGTVQFGFMLSPAQLFDGTVNTEEIILHAIVLDLYPGPILA